MAIHPAAVVSPDADLGVDVSIGPFCVVEKDARIGDRCRLAPRATIKETVVLGADNVVCEGATIGGLPQHLSPPGPPGGLTVGDGNQIRENVTVHRALHAGELTEIGSGCLLMAGSHVAHDCVVEDNVVLTNNVMLAGHVTVGARAYMGGGAAVHQHCRIGRLAMVGGMARVVQDVPPFVTIDGDTGMVVGLNRVGLRRAGFDRHAIRDLKEAYRIIYRSGASFADRLETLAKTFGEGPAAEYAEFLSGGSRGFARERRSPPGGTIRPLQEAIDPAEEGRANRRLAG